MKREDDPRFPTQWHAEQAEQCVVEALDHLRKARDLLSNAKAPKTLARVNAAISSAKGAVRNAGYRVTRAFYTERRNAGEIEERSEEDAKHYRIFQHRTEN